MTRTLVALVRGIAEMPGTGTEGVQRPLLRESLEAPGTELLDTGVVSAIRDLGCEVEQRSLVLRPPWRSDTAAVAQLTMRPTGPADYSFLELNGPLRAAATAGCQSNSYAQAVAQVGDDLTRAMDALRDAEPTRVWLVASELPEPVYRTFDLIAALRRALPLRRRLDVAVYHGCALLRFPSGALRERVLELLGRQPFSECCEPYSDARVPTGTLLLRARPDVAFGDSPVWARPALTTDPLTTAGTVRLPYPARGDGPLTPAQVAARLLIDASRRQAARRATRSTAVESSPVPATGPTSAPV